MATKDDCDEMNKKIDDMDIDIHGHLRSLSIKFDKHHTTLTNHITRFDRHEEEVLVRQDAQIVAQTLNTEAINRLSASTQGMVEAWTTANGVAKFVKWVSGLVVGGLALLAYFSK